MQVRAMRYRWYQLLVVLAVSGCSAGASDPVSVAESIRVADCGLSPAVSSYLRGRGSGRDSLENGGPVTACTLPTAEDIANACELREGVPIPGSRDPDNPEGARYSFPVYSVRAPACTFADVGRTSADCAFVLVSEQRAPARVRARLTFRFRDLSNSIAHDYFNAGWEVGGICAPH